VDELCASEPRSTLFQDVHTLSLISCQMIRVISSPSSSTTGFFTLIFLMPEDAILRCPIAVFRVFTRAGTKLAVGRRAEAAVVVGARAEKGWEAKDLVAKPQLVGRVSFAKRAGRSTEEEAGLMVDSEAQITSGRATSAKSGRAGQSTWYLSAAQQVVELRVIG
jgi:hypothetical protein